MKRILVYLNFFSCLLYLALHIVVQNQWNSGKWLIAWGYILFSVILTAQLLYFLQGKNLAFFFLFCISALGILASIGDANHFLPRHSSDVGLFLIVVSGCLNAIAYEAKQWQKHQVD